MYVSVRKEEKFEIDIHNLAKEELREIAIRNGREHTIETFTRDNGEPFTTVDIYIGQVKIVLYS